MLRVPTVIFALFPRMFLGDVEENINLEEWSEKVYTWKRDPLYGVWDHAKSPSYLLNNPQGDCVDYARLVASCLYQGETSFSICFLFKAGFPFGHVVVETDSKIYSSGVIYEKTMEEYMNENSYNFFFRRDIQ